MFASAPGKKKRLGEGAKYSRKAVVELRRIFDEHDADHDGRVTITELWEALEESKLALKHFELSAFRTLDINKDGRLTFDEYLRRFFPYANDKEYELMLYWGTPTKAPEPPPPLFKPNPDQLEEIKQMFNSFDRNRNGVIDIAELFELAERCGYECEDMHDLFKQTDTDTNGTISFSEFVQLMKTSYI